MMDAEWILQGSEQAVFRLRELYQRHGYLPYKMSKFEEYDLYVRNKSFLVSEQILTFTDMDGKLMALKPDVTLSILKNSSQGCRRSTTTRTSTAPPPAPTPSTRSCRRAWSASATWTTFLSARWSCWRPGAWSSSAATICWI